MNDGSFNGMRATRYTAQRIVSEVLVGAFTPRLKSDVCAHIEDAITDILEQQSSDIFDMMRHQYDLEDADNYLRGVCCLEEEYDESGNRILLCEDMLNRLIDETSYIFDAELGVWDNFENGHKSLLQKDGEYKEYVNSLEVDDDCND